MKMAVSAQTLASIDIERAVLGSLMGDINQQDALGFLGELSESDFCYTPHQTIFGALVSLIKAGATPDLPLIWHKVQDTVDPKLLAELRGFACFPRQLPYYIEILHKDQRRRTLGVTLERATTNLQVGMETQEIEDDLITSLSKRCTTGTTCGVSDGVDLEAFLQGKETVSGVEFGIDQIDMATCGGIKRGEIMITAARTSVGKSALAVEVGLNAVMHGWSTLYMSYEMNRSQVWHRALSYLSSVSLRKFREGYFNDFDKTAIRRAQQELTDGGFWPYFRVNCNANTPGELIRLIRTEQIKSGTDFLIIDHAGRMRTDSKARNDYERASEIINQLKDIAINLNIPMLVLWQLNRGVEKTSDKVPTLADLRDTGQAEEVADSVILLSRDNYYDKDIPLDQAMVTVNIAKVRDGGQVGTVKIPWMRIISRPGGSGNLKKPEI